MAESALPARGSAFMNELIAATVGPTACSNNLAISLPTKSRPRLAECRTRPSIVLFAMVRVCSHPKSNFTAMMLSGDRRDAASSSEANKSRTWLLRSD